MPCALCLPMDGPCSKRRLAQTLSQRVPQSPSEGQMWDSCQCEAYAMKGGPWPRRPHQQLPVLREQHVRTWKQIVSNIQRPAVSSRRLGGQALVAGWVKMRGSSWDRKPGEDLVDQSGKVIPGWRESGRRAVEVARDVRDSSVCLRLWVPQGSRERAKTLQCT